MEGGGGYSQSSLHHLHHLPRLPPRVPSGLQKIAALREAVLYAIFLDLQKAYDALDRSRCLNILERYGVGTRDLRLLRSYWERLKMVVRVGGYYGEPFRRDREASHREIHCLQPSSVWWWTRWSNTWSPWWGNGRGGEVAMTTSTRRRRRGGGGPGKGRQPTTGGVGACKYDGEVSVLFCG